MLFFFNDTATTEIYTLSLHDALPIFSEYFVLFFYPDNDLIYWFLKQHLLSLERFLLELHWNPIQFPLFEMELDRKSTRLNSSHANISYAVFCLKNKN